MPLTEDCGLIEWVPHTTGLRHVIQALYVRDGLYHKRTLAEVKETHERLKATPTTWMREILKKFPPVFHRWFLNRWKDRPAAWHGARTAFAHTAAVWSMVGHVVGLGDRHGENILLDQESGDCVHVDFSCLFDKGLELETPEMVPFRLTQNIVDGLGAGGYEGVFMRASEITLSVLRAPRGAHVRAGDVRARPAGGVEPRARTGGRRGENAERAGWPGKEALDKITSRLEGVVVGVGSAPSLPLSPQGQARRLIEEATSRKAPREHVHLVDAVVLKRGREGERRRGDDATARRGAKRRKTRRWILRRNYLAIIATLSITHAHEAREFNTAEVPCRRRPSYRSPRSCSTRTTARSSRPRRTEAH